MRKELTTLNISIDFLPVKETMLDEYVDGSKEGLGKEENEMMLNLIHLRN